MPQAVERLLAGPATVVGAASAPAGRRGDALYKWHWRVTGARSVARVPCAAGVRAALPARPLRTTPPFTDPAVGAAPGLKVLPAPDSFPGVTRLLDGLIEVDARDTCESLPDVDADPCDRAPTRAAGRFATEPIPTSGDSRSAPCQEHLVDPCHGVPGGGRG